MALHVAGDAFSHKSIVPNSDTMKKELKANMIGEGGKNIFTKDEYKKIIDKLDAYTSTTGMTYSALDDNVADSGRKKKSHQNYADKPGSSGRRYTHGAKVVVTGLLKDYYYIHNKFDHNVFNNFGGTYDTVVPGKNNICMFRIYTYARKCIERKIISLVVSTCRLKHKILNDSVSFEIKTNETDVFEMVVGDNSYNPEDMMINYETETEIIEKAHNLLTDLEKQVFDLKISGFNYKEIAEILEKDPKTIDNAIQRLKQKMKKAISG